MQAMLFNSSRPLNSRRLLLLLLLLPTIGRTSCFVIHAPVRRPPLALPSPTSPAVAVDDYFSSLVAPAPSLHVQISTSSSRSSHFALGSSLDQPSEEESSSRMDLLDGRLQSLGASGYYFVKLDDNKNGEEKKEGGGAGAGGGGGGSDLSAEPVHVKTLIWEAVFVVRCRSGSGRIIEEVVDHHFCTALRVDDRVDLQRLYDLVKVVHSALESSDDQGDEQRQLHLRLARRDVAEELVGYESGTMPPIAHSTSMPLYVDEAVASMADDDTDVPVVSVGAGDLQYDLYIPTEEMLRVAKISSSVVQISSFSLQKRPKQQLDAHKKISSNKFVQKAAGESTDKAAASTEPPSDIEEQLAKAKGKMDRANILRKAAKKKGHTEALRRMLDAIGDEFPELMKCEEYGFGGIDKNALHTAAWKGDLEAITLLIERGNAFGLDLVNTVSLGSGNYGKSPIFYALTQCREDVVLLLLAHGADLLILNNKGQSPCSIAASHLKPEICQIMHDVEASQLQNGCVFRNYRKTHSDGRSYGDLDPRFEIDDDNMNQSVQEELKRYHEIVKNETEPIDCDVKEDGDPGSEERHRLLQSTMIPGLPRSIAETIRHWNIPQEERDEPNSNEKDKGNGKIKQKRQSKRRNQTKAPTKEDDEIDYMYDALEPLTFERTVFDENHRSIIVEDTKGIDLLAKTIDECVASAMDAADAARRRGLGQLSDTAIIESSFSLDCEWRPSFQRGFETPVATLQLHHAASNRSFLVDVQCILQASVPDADASMSDVEQRLSDALTKLFTDRNVALLGFGVAQDLGKLAASFPHLPCFRRFESVVDLHTVSRNVFAATPKNHMSSLQKMVAVLLGLSLDKKEQCSDWEHRPLTGSQISYALLDAAILPILLRSMLIDFDSGVTFKFEGYFLHKHPHLLTTTKLTCLGAFDDVAQYACPPQLAYIIPYGSCKVHLQHVMARQIFMTGNEDPGPPEILPIETQQKIAISRIPRGKRTQKKFSDISVANSSGASKRKIKKKTIKLHTVSADLENLPKPGQIIGYTKDSCIHEVLGQEFIDSLSANNSRLGFNRRGGVLALDNAFCLFINFALSEAGALPSSWLYRNAFSDNGRRLTFTVNSERAHEKALVDFFVENGQSTEDRKVLLFARTSTQTKFMYCGVLACEICEREDTESDDDGNYVNLVLELMEYDNLIANGPTGEPSAFMEMVSFHTAALAMERELFAES